MYEIKSKRQLSDEVVAMDIYAPKVVKRAQAGQFVMLRVWDGGERIPLTIASFDHETGLIGIIFQTVGKTTHHLSQLEVGDCLADFVGPLGVPTHLDGYKKVAVIGGGLGTAIAYPQAKRLVELGTETDAIIGFRNKDLIILEDELKTAGANVFVTTDDGSNGKKGFVTDVLRECIESGEKYDLVIAIGPLPMMRAVCNLTREFGIKTIISMNSTMVDGTGMCGCCRVTVGGKVKFACVDGPDFDGHEVDFDEAMRRQAMYREQEKTSLEKHKCRLK